MRLPDRTVLITGGAGAFGSAIAARVVAEGGIAVIADIDRDAGAAAAAHLGARGSYVWLDVREPDAWTRAVDEVTRRYGGVSGLVNNAGSTSIHRLEELTPAALMELTIVNQLSVVYGMQAVFAALRDAGAGAGSIVNITSIAATFGVGYNAGYAAAKGAVEALSRAAATEWSVHGIRVNTVVPGTIDTPMARGSAGGDYSTLANLEERVRAMVPLQRAGTVDEVAAAVTYLLADESGFCTGTSIVLDGGQTNGRLRQLAT